VKEWSGVEWSGVEWSGVGYGRGLQVRTTKMWQAVVELVVVVVAAVVIVWGRVRR
jgi:hypothetical protein